MASESHPFGLHWFRRDLRVSGNPSLTSHWKRRSGRVVGVFTIDPRILDREDFSTRRFTFLLKTLEVLRIELRELGSDLLVLEGSPEQAFERLLTLLGTKRSGCVSVSFNRDYEPFARERDAKLSDWFDSKGVSEILVERDHLLLEPWEVVKADESPFQVYTPFKKKWLAAFNTEKIQSRVAAQNKALDRLDEAQRKQPFQLRWPDLLKSETIEKLDCFEFTLRKAQAGLDIALPDAGLKSALKLLDTFEPKLQRYEVERDVPSHSGTSKMSIYLKNGSITTAQVIARLSLKGRPEKASKYLEELIWREFYYSILFHFPHVEKKAFQSKYDTLKWENDSKNFEAWCKGETGFPIVDAGMRQLNQTGWMHNRVRMIVASFLTKDLLIDWRMGERYFMQKLLDGDLAPNNGGWQWAASTGCDPQPYFRVFNPWLQLGRFDPKGAYVKSHVAELSTQEVPSEPPVSAIDPTWPKNYVRPIVEHSEQKDKAIAMFKAARP